MREFWMLKAASWPNSYESPKSQWLSIRTRGRKVFGSTLAWNTSIFFSNSPKGGKTPARRSQSVSHFPLIG